MRPKAERPDADEAALLQELMQRVATELELSPEQLAMAALNLAIGPDALLRKGDDDWIQNTRRNDRDRDRHSGDRRERRERPAGLLRRTCSATALRWVTAIGSSRAIWWAPSPARPVCRAG